MHASPLAEYVKLVGARLRYKCRPPTLFNSGAQICRDDMRMQCNVMHVPNCFPSLLIVGHQGQQG